MLSTNEELIIKKVVEEVKKEPRDGAGCIDTFGQFIVQDGVLIAFNVIREVKKFK